MKHQSPLQQYVNDDDDDVVPIEDLKAAVGVFQWLEVSRCSCDLMLRGERMFCFPSSMFLRSLSDRFWSGGVFSAAQPGGFEVVKMVIMVPVVCFCHLPGSLRSNQLVTHRQRVNIRVNFSFILKCRKSRSAETLETYRKHAGLLFVWLYCLSLQVTFNIRNKVNH